MFSLFIALHVILAPHSYVEMGQKLNSGISKPSSNVHDTINIQMYEFPPKSRSQCSGLHNISDPQFEVRIIKVSYLVVTKWGSMWMKSNLRMKSKHSFIWSLVTKVSSLNKALIWVWLLDYHALLCTQLGSYIGVVYITTNTV